jgi:RES domain-containing protein
MPVVYRVAKRRYPVYDAAGSVLTGGRWTSKGRAVIYTAEHYATAILEKLVHAGRLELPGAHHAAAIFIPEDVRIERFDPASHLGWDHDGSAVARAYGDAWLTARRTPVLAVPSVPAQPAEWNYLIDPMHPEARRIHSLDPFDVVWDGRLFGPPPEAAALP